MRFYCIGSTLRPRTSISFDLTYEFDESKFIGLRFRNSIFSRAVAEFKEFERRFKFKPRFKYGWFHLKLHQMFQDLSRRFI